MDKAHNDLSAAVPKFCLTLEEARRTPDGRVRTSQDFLAGFFPHDDRVCSDRILKYLPPEVRGPIIAAWGIRGSKAALRDSDEKLQSVLHDALIAGDVDDAAFEEGLSAETLVQWAPLANWWTFWRGAELTKHAIHKALSTAYELLLFDAAWFLETLSAKGGALKGTDVLADGLSKEELAQWVARIHRIGDGSPTAIVAALGWDWIVAKTPNEVLVASLDAVARKVGLVGATASKETPKPTEAAKEPPPENLVVARETRPRRTVPPPLPMSSWTPTAPAPEESTWSDLPALGAGGEEILSVLDDEIVSSTSENSDGDKATAMPRYDEDEQTSL